MTPNTGRATRNKRGTASESPDHEARLKQLDDELLAFHQFCKTSGFTEDEMRQICAPLLSAFRRAQLRKALIWGLVGLTLIAAVYGLCQIGTVALHLSAVGRILMIKILPMWDWTPMFYESCLMNNPFYGDYNAVTEEDCVSCEALENVDRLEGVSYQQLLDGYLQRDAPVIVMDAMESWSVMNSDDFWFDNITQLYLQDERLRDTVPCVMTTNIRTASSDLFAFLKKIHNPKLDKWFVHWQNCDINAVKALRKFYQRPYFLARSVSPAHFNWVLMSSDYNAKLYKKIELDSGLIMLAQLRGSTTFKLTPHNACNASCSELVGELNEGEILVFTNYIWTFDYLPSRGLDNVAILTETVWEELNIY